jgi:hypothetical protein
MFGHVLFPWIICVVAGDPLRCFLTRGAANLAPTFGNDLFL